MNSVVFLNNFPGQIQLHKVQSIPFLSALHALFMAHLPISLINLSRSPRTICCICCAHKMRQGVVSQKVCNCIINDGIMLHCCRELLVRWLSEFNSVTSKRDNRHGKL